VTSWFAVRRERTAPVLRRTLPIVLVLVAACSSSPVANGPAVEEVSGTMPKLAGSTLTGDALGPRDYAGRVLVVNFWATSCVPCRRELPVLSAAHTAAGEDGPFVVGVNFREGSSIAGGYLDELSVTFPSLRDPDGSLAYRFGVPFLPTTFLVDTDGRLRFRVTGEIDAATLDELVAEISAA
jgi:thiol-disulfide isomerase/thioredoxin